MQTAWVAARTCYSPDSPIELINGEEPEDKEMLKLLNHIITHKHHSVLEHCHMTFAVKDVSRTLLAQYSRHRIGVSLSVQSQRYVSEKHLESTFDYIIPQSVLRDEVSKLEFKKTMNDIQEAYNKLKEIGIPSEDARFVLPGAASTNMVTSLNLRSIFDLYEKRVVAKGAQWEIKEFVKELIREMLKYEPWLEKYFSEVIN